MTITFLGLLQIVLHIDEIKIYINIYIWFRADEIDEKSVSVAIKKVEQISKLMVTK